MSMRVEPMPGLTARGSVYVSNPVLEDVSGQFEEGLREDVARTFLDSAFCGDDLVLPLSPFSWDDAVRGFRVDGTLLGYGIELHVSKPRDAGHHEFLYLLMVR